MSEQNNNKNINYCSYCGSEIRNDARFCFACGHGYDFDPTNEPTQNQSSTIKDNETSLKIARIKEQISIKIAQKKKEYQAKKALKQEVYEKKRQDKKEKKKLKKSYRRGIIVGIFITCMAISIGGFFTIGALTYGTYEESFTYYYNSPSPPGSIESCDIYMDIGNINLQYNSTPVNYHVKVEVDIKVSGLFVSGKNYENFYNPINWENDSSASFSLTTIIWSWIDPTNWFKMQDTVLTVTLRTDVIYNITAASTTGGVSLTVPDNIIINDLLLNCITGGVSLHASGVNFTGKISCNTITGGVLLNFTNCVFDGDIQGSAITGGVEFNTYNAFYAKDINLNLGTTTGGVLMNIQHYMGMGANITGTASTVTGGISLTYIDTESAIGAKFTGTTTTGAVILPSDSGFTLENSHTSKTDNYNVVSSRYTLTLSTTTGSVSITGISTV